MKVIYRAILLLTITSIFLLASPASAKGPADKMVIEHPGSGERIEVSDTEALEQFNPWAGQFLGTGGPLEAAPYIGQRIPYHIYTYLLNDKDEYEMCYIFYYYPDPAGGTGYIYLPGPGEPYYSVNAGTIIRGKEDGHWQEAAPAFERKFRELAPGEQVRPGGAGLRMPAGVILGSASGLLLLGAGIFLAGRRDPGRRLDA